jgi:hypothetical protein
VSRVSASPQRVELERHALDSELLQELVGEREQLDVGGGSAAPMISASSWWNWRKRPFCGRS